MEKNTNVILNHKRKPTNTVLRSISSYQIKDADVFLIMIFIN